MPVCHAVCSEIMKRLNYLDTLKIVLTLLVVFHHAAEPYYPESAWPYKPSNADEMMPWIWHFLSVNAAFFMGLFFLIATIASILSCLLTYLLRLIPGVKRVL